ncbi:hypothetical protein N0V88_007993 [Collariella sp. IMI 366227]|nr:hypothetical protein N0V88_007993 [Collariella sp. IMI 366227]
MILFFVGDLYLMRFEERRSQNDLEQGCQILQQALEYAPDDTNSLSLWCGKLGYYLQKSYEQNQDTNLLTESIKVCQRGLVVVPDVPRCRGTLLETEANGLQARAKRNNSMEDLNTAVSLSFDAVAAAPNQDVKAQYLTNLGCRLEDRFDRRRRVDDLRDAIRVSRSALPSPPDPPGLLTNCIKHNIGVQLLKLHAIDKQDATFEEGLSLLHEAVETMPSPGDVPALWYNSLASAYRSRYWRNRDNLEDLRTAIDHQTQAMERLPRHHPNWPGYADNMAWLRRERAERTRNREDLQIALAFVVDAARSLPENHVHRSHILFSLARLYTLAYTFEFGGMFEVQLDGVRWNSPWEDLSIDLYLESLEDPLGDPISRMVAASKLMVIFRDRGAYARGVEVGETVLNVLRRTNTRLLSRDDQQRLTAAFSDMAVETCALSIQAGDNPAQALELLELGRGLILGLLIEDRSDISSLATEHPEPAARFESFRDVISRPVDTGVNVALRQVLVRERDNQIREFDELLEKIRWLPGQERFLQGPTAEELKNLAIDGPIVVVNVAEQRSDAILVTAASIKLVPLPELRRNDVQEWLDKKPMSEFGEKNKLCSEYLSWLWTACVEPILSTLHLLDKPMGAATELTRVWWMGAGLAAFLPFHAAGDHRPGSTANAYAHTISSYTPTTRAFGYARARASALRTLPAVTEKPELFVALMPTTPPVNGKRMRRLRTDTELAGITAAATDTHTVIPMEYPTRHAILDRLPQCEMAHFACHGFSEPSSPSDSYLILQRQPQSSDGEQPDPSPIADFLTVRDLSRSTLGLGRARIAYLSACSTAENRAEQLVDEVIHIASGFQVAGFPHVIASVCSAVDETAVDLLPGPGPALLLAAVPRVFVSHSAFDICTTLTSTPCYSLHFWAVATPSNPQRHVPKGLKKLTAACSFTYGGGGINGLPAFRRGGDPNVWLAASRFELSANEGPSQPRLATYDGIEVSDVWTGKFRGEFSWRGPLITAAAVNEEATLLAVGDYKGGIQMFEMITG